jgi:soluble lytic murein transglycosylase
MISLIGLIIGYLQRALSILGRLRGLLCRVLIVGKHAAIFILLIQLVELQESVAANTDVSECSAVKLARHTRWNEAFNCAKAHNDPVLYKIVQWLKYRDPKSNASFEEIIRFISVNRHFPDRALLISRAESKLDSKVDKSNALIWLNNNPPTTSDGLKYYLSISKHDPKNNKFIKLVHKTWIEAKYSKGERKDFLVKYRKYLKQEHHIAKLDYLLRTGNSRLDPDLLQLLDKNYQSLFKARVLLLKNRGDLNNILNLVPGKLRKDPGLLYAEALWHRKREHDDKVARLILANSNIAEIKSDKWFNIRMRTALELVDKGEHLTAYKIASSHNYKDFVNYVDGEWFAGKIAYSYLKKDNKALVHFKNILNNSKFSISVSKGAYWTGIALQRIGNNTVAQKYFVKAAAYPDTFYGQLAKMKLRINNRYVIPKAPQVTHKDLAWLKNNDLVRASHIFSQDNQYGISRKFMSNASRAANTIAKRYLLAKFGYDISVNSLSVISSKESARRGAFFVDYSYPTLPNAPKSNLEEALLWSIIRQESEFNSQARSSVGAMGLMQLMYPTARQTAKELNLKFTRVSLYRNPQLNMRLGSHYLSSLLKDYNGSYVLAIAAYNAGPHNVNKWIKKYGDPRELKNPDKVVEWIEKTPFSETRSYIQHVLSNVQVYRNLLAHKKSSNVRHINLTLHKDLVLPRKVA